MVCVSDVQHELIMSLCEHCQVVRKMTKAAFEEGMLGCVIYRPKVILSAKYYFNLNLVECCATCSSVVRT